MYIVNEHPQTLPNEPQLGTKDESYLVIEENEIAIEARRVFQETGTIPRIMIFIDECTNEPIEITTDDYLPEYEQEEIMLGA